METGPNVYDANGALLQAGDAVQVLSIPDWLIHDLPEDEQADILRCVGQTLCIQRIDQYGYAWLGSGHTEELGEDAVYTGHSFAVPGECVSKT